MSANVLARDDGQDLAVLAAARPLAVRPAAFRRLSVTVGEPVVIAGFPREVVSRGLLKAVSTTVVAPDGRAPRPGLMGLAAATPSGTSGGPVLDLSGRVVGVVTGMLYDAATGKPAANPGLAVRGDVVQRFLEQAGIPYELAGEHPSELQALAADAAGHSVLVECLR